MNLAEIKNNVEKEMCKLIIEKTGITLEELINEDYLNEYDSKELDKKTKLFYSVALKSPSNNVLGGIYINDFTFEQKYFEWKQIKTISLTIPEYGTNFELEINFEAQNLFFEACTDINFYKLLKHIPKEKLNVEDLKKVLY